jgi:hypothetical protein
MAALLAMTAISIASNSSTEFPGELLMTAMSAMTRDAGDLLCLRGRCVLAKG